MGELPLLGEGGSLHGLTAPAYRDAWSALALAVLLAWLLVPVARLAALRLGAIDAPDEARRVHHMPTPRLGGVGMLVALLAAVAAYVDWSARFGMPLLDLQQLTVVIICAAAACLLGAVDDVLDIDWRLKLSGQVVIAIAVILGPLLVMQEPSVRGLPLVVNFLDLPFLRPVELPPAVSIALVTLWIVAVMNMLNFIDGVDGLAAGQTAVIAGTFAVIAASYSRFNVAVLAAATAGAAIGFLRHNFRRRGASVFMGDSGSMLLGFLLAVISVQGVLKTTAAISLAIPLALLAVPIVDAAFVVLKRMKYRLPVSGADRWHLHHRLLNVGLSPRGVAIALVLWTTSMSTVALALRFAPYGNSRNWRAEGVWVLVAVIAFALAMSMYLAVRLEILKSPRVRARNRGIAQMVRARLERQAARPGALADTPLADAASATGDPGRSDARRGVEAVGAFGELSADAGEPS